MMKEGRIETMLWDAKGCFDMIKRHLEKGDFSPKIVEMMIQLVDHGINDLEHAAKIEKHLHEILVAEENKAAETLKEVYQHVDRIRTDTGTM